MSDDTTAAHAASTSDEQPKPQIQIGSQRSQSTALSGAAAPLAPEGSELKSDVAPAKTEVPHADVDPAQLLNRRFSDQDLEDEIAAAMGDSIEDLMAGQVAQKSDEQSIEIDERYVAVVAKIHRDSVLVELPGQQNGVIPLKQFEELPEVGSQLEVVVVGFSTAEQLYDVIVPGASVAVADWSDLAEGVVVDAKITGHNKGGLECEINRIRGFIPASQVSLYRVEDFSSFVDETMSCVVTEANEERGNLVLSRRAILEREREAAKEQLMAELAVGQTREGIVTRLQKFGAFVDLGGVDGLIHISQLSWDNIRDPSEVVEEGQKVKVRIEKIDPTTGKIGLSYRDLMHHPWEGIETKYHVGTVVTGTVSKLMEFGAFVKLESGIEGLIHISELSHKRVNRVSHVVEEGQRVEVKVLSVDAESQRISLSMKQVQESVDEGDAASDASEEPEIKHVPKTPVKSLKGGTTGSAGGEQFGLKW